MTHTSANFNGDLDNPNPDNPRMKVDAYQDGLTFTIKNSDDGIFKMRQHEIDILLGLLAERARINKTNDGRIHPMTMTLTSPETSYGI